MKWSGVMRKSVRKNPHAVALGKLGGTIRTEAKQLANQENGRKGGLGQKPPKGARLSTQRASSSSSSRQAVTVAMA